MTRSSMDGSPGRRVANFLLLSVIASILFPAFTLLIVASLSAFASAIGLAQGAPAAFGVKMILSAALSLALAIAVARKTARALTNMYPVARSAIGEPAATCIAFGAIGGIVGGGVPIGAILLLGHARPAALDWDNVLPLALIGFLMSAAIGLPLGIWRR